MGRKYIDCREYGGDGKCSLYLSADTEEELLEAVVEHASGVHGYRDTPDFREKMRKCFREES